MHLQTWFTYVINGMKAMNIISEITKSHLKKNVPAVRVGDTVRVHQKVRDIDAKGRERERIQIFEGLVIAKKHGNGIEGTFTVRKIAVGSIGVERVFPLHSPLIVKVERLSTARPRQSKLYYMRGLRKTVRLPRQRRSYVVWEEKGASEEIEAMKEEAAEAAAEKAEEETTEPAEPIAPAEETANKTDTQPESANDEAQMLNDESSKKSE